MIEEVGIYPKYLVFKHPRFIPDDSFAKSYKDMEGVDLEPVEDFVFVLKPSTDKHARVAMAAYAESVREENHDLANDLYELLVTEKP